MATRVKQETISDSLRSSVHFGDFYQNYRRLYPQAGDSRIEALLSKLGAALAQRPQELRDSDALRDQQKDWFQAPHHVGMMLYVDLFAGDIPGVIRHIPYFKELGITYLHLMPLLQPRQGPNDGGYAVADYRKVDSRLGSIDDLRALAARLREEGMLLVIDFVMNHTAREHAWAQAALRGESRYQDYYLMFDDRRLPDAYEQSLPEVFPDFAPGNFTWQPEISKWVWTTFYQFQWDLNYRNPDVFEAMLDEILFLSNAGIDVLRLDAVPFLWKNMGTTCQNQQEVVYLLAAYRALLRMVAPGMILKSEAIVAPRDIIKYLGSGGFEGKVCEIGYNATLMNHLWHALASENTHLLRTTLSNLPAIPKQATWINYIRCHDDIGWGISDENAGAVGQNGHNTRIFCTDFYAGVYPHSYAQGYAFQRDRISGEARISGTAAALAGLQKAQIEADAGKIDQAIRRLTVLNGVTFFMRGIPLIFSGDEIGQLNDFSYLLDPEKALDNRWTHRPPMNWAKAELRHTPGSVEQRIFDMHRSFIHARRESTALHGRSDDRIIWVDNHHLFLCERMYAGERMMLVANLNRNPQRFSLWNTPDEWRGGSYTDAITGQPFKASNGEILISGYGVLWLRLAPQNQPAQLKTVEVRTHVRTEFGEEVYLTGATPALGNWAPTAALRCATDQEYPWWKASFEAPVGEAFSYKWIRVRQGNIVQWAPENIICIPGFIE